MIKFIKKWMEQRRIARNLDTEARLVIQKSMLKMRLDRQLAEHEHFVAEDLKIREHEAYLAWAYRTRGGYVDCPEIDTWLDLIRMMAAQNQAVDYPWLLQQRDAEPVLIK